MSFLLENCSSMTHLTLTIEDEFRDVVEPLIHTRLSSLTLNIPNRLDWEAFFLPYTFSLLISLTALGEAVNYDWSPKAVTSLIDRSKCKIESLIVGEDSADLPDFPANPSRHRFPVMSTLGREEVLYIGCHPAFHL